jgi:aspartyl-tRNA(Asn)/glutamyl-tRNA(Gln) amidotransferase subunit A
MSDFCALSVVEIQDGLAKRDFSARELAEATLQRIESIDKQVHAFLELTPELALEAAERIDKDRLAETPVASIPGSLLGIPIAYKDNMNLTGTHTTCASHMLSNYVSPFTATCVTKSLESGALPIGKLNMDEFAFGSSTETSVFGPTANPWDLSRVPGGSSGGSAAAVGAGLVTVALGSDTGGSIRQPASFCGVVGFKPSYGVVSRHGVVAFGSSLDQVGPFGRSVADVAAVMDSIAGRDPQDCTSQDIRFNFREACKLGAKDLRIGYVPAYLEMAGLQPEVKRATLEAMRRLEDLGAKLVEVDLPNAQAALVAYYVIGPCEAFSNLSRFDSVRYGYCEPKMPSLNKQYEESRAHGFGPEATRRIMLGSYLLSAGVYDRYYYPALQARTLITEDYRRAFERCDVLLMPTSPRTAFKFGEVTDPVSMYISDIFTVPMNIAGNGSMSLPVGMGDESGLPIGIQIAGPQLKDESIFRVAAALESTYDIPRLAELATFPTSPSSEGGAR